MHCPSSDSDRPRGPIRGRIALAVLAASAILRPVAAGEIARGEVYSVVELPFRGPRLGPADAPARDVEFWVRFRHEGGRVEHRVLGFWDGDGRGGASGEVFKVRFCPTEPGRWILAEVHSSAPELDGQHRGESVVAAPSDRHGFWMVDDASPGRRWYRRSDGSHQYIIGNTQYSFLSGRKAGGAAIGVDVAADVARNAGFFKKLRFSLMADRYPDPEVKPFLDDSGRPTDDGDSAHRPNPAWFGGRADPAVAAAFAHDLVADLILCGPDTRASRSTLRAAGNGGDPTPFLRYVAARYGSYPNVWFCLCNEFDIKEPKYSEEQIARFGRVLGGFLPYSTPLSVHSAPSTWPAGFDDLPAWHDHIIIQHKLRDLSDASDTIRRARRGPRAEPVLDDELSYQGAGDKHSEADTIEAHLGVFLGGGYGTTGWKTGEKLGHYFWGGFDPAEHSAADALAFLRRVIDVHITFWRLEPSEGIFEGLDPGFRVLAWPGREYVLGTDQPRRRLVAVLPRGRWAVARHDVIAQTSAILAESASGRFEFDAPASRAVLFHFQKMK